MYRRLSESVAVTHGRRKRNLKGPVERLRHQVGGKRYFEFAEWLNRLRAVKGSSVPSRYRSMLTIMGKAIDLIEIEFRYTFQDFDQSNEFDPRHARDHLRKTREQLVHAREDTAALQPLLEEMMRLNERLGRAKQSAACPPQVLTTAWEQIVQKTKETREHAETAAHEARLQESRKWLRELSRPNKQHDEDVRYGKRWIRMDALVELLRDDLRGYAGHKALWSSLPAVQRLVQDYGISERDAERLLAAHAQHAAGETVRA